LIIRSSPQLLKKRALLAPHPKARDHLVMQTPNLKRLVVPKSQLKMVKMTVKVPMEEVLRWLAKVQQPPTSVLKKLRSTFMKDLTGWAS
jgi:hypothetical protein